MDRQAADAARRGVNQAGIAALERIGGMREVVSGHALEHDGRGRLEVETIGDLHQQRGWNQRILGVGAARHGVGYAVADDDFSDIRANGLHRARAFAAQRDRDVRLIEAGAEIDVDEVHAAGCDAHQRLFGARRGPRNFHQFHLFGTTGHFHLNGFHKSTSL